MRLLIDTEHPRRHLHADSFHQRRERGEGAAGRGNVWVEVSREDVALDRVRVYGEPCSLRRLVITTDAGMGKTATLQWLRCRLNRPGSKTAAFFIPLSSLPSSVSDVHGDGFLREVLLPLFQHAGSGASAERSLVLLRQLQKQGRLVLLFDALDQTRGDGGAVAWLRALLASDAWKDCRIIVSGRPHAVDRHWQDPSDPRDLFGNQSTGWRFIQLCEFTKDEQRLYLGKNGEGKDRFDLIPREAREIATVPRVLSYLRSEVRDSEYAAIRTPSDVYWWAVDHMIRRGLKPDGARRLGLAPGTPLPADVSEVSVRLARKLLAAMAFQMTSMQIPFDPQRTNLKRNPLDEVPEAGAAVPNFDRIAGGGEFEKFCDAVFKRVKKPRYTGNYPIFEQDLESLRTMNEVLAYGLLDVDTIDHILWRNRSLQEFLTAYWMANYGKKKDARRLWDWIYQPDIPVSREYYWVWRFAAEMPQEARSGEHWVRAMAPLYRQGDAAPVGTKRSGEMIYRSWQTLNAYVVAGNSEARRIRDQFLSEFEQEILAGRRGEDAKAAAREFCDSFIEVPAGECPGGSVDAFWMSRFPTLNRWYRLYDPGHGIETERHYYNSYPEKSGLPNSPVIFVSWYDAWAFCLWANWEGHRCRLPNEQEWEYAARGGANWDWDWNYWWGNEFDPSKCTADMDWRSGHTTPLDVKDTSHRNPFGFYDILGNVWEWCADWYVAGLDRVIRGGGWYSFAWCCRSADRDRFTPDRRPDGLGFRVALVRQEQESGK